ncbi:PREDICTED: binding partner of ACD11 1-like [Ipomoea nil]|uniref:binding partner of ACD11 1-like n=1 Tax=Ipomoea nil TaxID=35883 RepID=UPI00090192D8|nr:PREDICTED: binding partner of ACD11 1-like [Ipomoea nil]
MSVRTVKVCNVSLSASQEDIMEFFSFSGEIEYVEMQSANERSETAYVTFKDPQGAETAVLLSGSTIVDQSVTVDLDPEYKLPPNALLGATATENQTVGAADSAILTAEDVVSSMLAKGFILGKDALNKAKDFDEKHQFTSTASATVSSFDQRIGFTEKVGVGATIVNDKVKEMDQKLQVSEKTKSAFAVAEQTVSTAGSSIMRNRYILTGATWVTGAYSRVTKAAEEVGQKTKAKMVEEEQGRNADASEGNAQINTSESSKAPTTPGKS